MIQKCSLIKVLEIFFQEPTTVHFIREISRKINLAQTSTRNHIETLFKENLIVKKESKPFDGFIANRDNDKFKHFKQAYNFYSLLDLKQRIIEKVYPQQIILFGSYLRGEDIESSDIDIVIISKVKKTIELKDLEKRLKREINLIFVEKTSELSESVQENLKKGLVMYG
ncbi:MAG: nucleotidyltransferase domain-containing protein [archaeon]